MTQARIALLWRQLRERIQLLNRHPDSRPSRDEARALVERQRRERRQR